MSETFRCALVVGGVVENIVVHNTDDDWRLPPGVTIVPYIDDAVRRGDLYDAQTDTFTHLPDPEPEPLPNIREGDASWFRSLFTAEERVKIEALRSHLRLGVTGEQLLADSALAALADMMAWYDKALHFDLAKDVTQYGIGVVLRHTYTLGQTSVQVIASPERAAEILAGSPQ
jgi:hypothetical protein